MENPNSDDTSRMAAMAGAIAGTSLLFISTMFSQRTPLDFSLKIALYCFSGSLPIAIVLLLLIYKKLESTWISIPFGLAITGTLVGIVAVLWHINIVAAWVFGITIVISVIYYFMFLAFSDAEQKTTDSDQKYV